MQELFVTLDINFLSVKMVKSNNKEIAPSAKNQSRVKFGSQSKINSCSKEAGCVIIATLQQHS